MLPVGGLPGYLTAGHPAGRGGGGAAGIPSRRWHQSPVCSILAFLKMAAIYGAPDAGGDMELPDNPSPPILLIPPGLYYRQNLSKSIKPIRRATKQMPSK